MTEQVVTGNRLHDGAVIFLGEDGGWTSRIEDARVATTEEDAKTLEDLAKAAVTARQVVGPYLIAVVADAGGVKPVRYRERLRAYGPSVHPGFGRQDVPAHLRLGAEAADALRIGAAG